MLGAAAPVGDYLRLSPFFETQDGPNYCGPTTMAMLLNMLGAAPPPGPEGTPRRFTQHNVFTPRTETLRPRQAVVRKGMSLPVLAGYLEAHGLSSDLHFARDDDPDRFRRDRRRGARRPRPWPGDQLPARRPRPGGRGHTSPLAAYHPETDRFLVLDVSRYRYPPVWVRARDLFTVMNTEAGRNSRGYVVAAR